jgi:hypothetical protein
MPDTKTDKGSTSETKTKTSPITGSVIKDAAGEPVKVTDTKPKS